MKPNIIQRIAVAALLIMAGLQTTQAQGIRVHYKNGSITDVPAALFDRMEPSYIKNNDNPDNPVNPDNPDIPDIPDGEPVIKVEPIDLGSLDAVLGFASTLQKAGMPLNLGSTPPTVNGTFSLKPIGVVAQWSNDPETADFEPLDQSDELVIKFSNQSGNYVWINLYDVDKDGADIAYGAEYNLTNDGFKSYIIGNGNKFTAGFKYSIEWGSLYFNMVYVFSAEVSGNDLKNLHVAVISLDRSNNVEEYGIAKDGDGTSQTTTWSPRIYNEWDSRVLTRRLAARQKASTEGELCFTIYKTDGTQFSVKDSDLEFVETYEASFDERITQQIPQQYLGKMATYMPIYSGNTPPTVDGTYRISVNTLGYDAGGTYSPGHTFVDYIADFSNQDIQKNTVDYQNKEVDNNGAILSQGNKAEMVLMGEGDNFTAFVITEGTSNGIYIKIANVISGTVTADGIKNIYLGILMIDKGDDSASSNKLMKRGVFRVFNDGDGLASKTSWNARRLAPKAGTEGQLSILSAE